MACTKKNNGLILLLFLLALQPASAYRVNPYLVSTSGAETAGGAGIQSLPFFSIDAIFNNPASLAYNRRPGLVWEIETGGIFVGFTDYRINIDPLLTFGLTVKSRRLEKISPTWGLGLFSLFRSLPQVNTRNQRLRIFNFNMKKLGYCRSFMVNDNIALGFNAGLTISWDDLAGTSDTYGSTFPNLQLGYNHRLSDKWRIGSYFLSPVLLWWPGKTRDDEFSPMLLNFGTSFTPAPGFSIYAELSYQGWDWVLPSDHSGLDRGKHPFDFFQNIFVNAALRIIPIEMDLNMDSRQEQIELQEEKLGRLNEEMNKVRFSPSETVIREKMKEEQEKRKELRDKMYDIQYKTISKNELRESHQLKFKLRKMYAEKKTLQKRIREPEVIFKIGEYTTRLSNELAELEGEMTELQEKHDELVYREMDEEDQAMVDGLKSEMNALNTIYKSNTIILREIRSNDRIMLENIEIKLREGEVLDENEKKVHNWYTHKQELTSAQKKVRKKIKKLKRIRKVTGRYYIGFRPDLVYRTDGDYVTMANLTLGASFAAYKDDRMRISLGFSDQVLLGLIPAFKDNENIETLKITFAYNY